MRNLAIALAAALALAAPAAQVEAQTGPSITVDAALRQASYDNGVSYWRLRCLSWYESRWQPQVKSSYMGRLVPGDGRYHGLFQFDLPTWADGSWRAGLEGASVYDPWAAAHVAAYLIAVGEGSRWPPLRWC